MKMKVMLILIAAVIGGSSVGAVADMPMSDARIFAAANRRIEAANRIPPTRAKRNIRCQGNLTSVSGVPGYYRIGYGTDCFVWSEVLVARLLAVCVERACDILADVSPYGGLSKINRIRVMAHDG